LIYNKGEGEVKGEEDTPRNAKTGSGVFSELYECSDQCKAFLNQCICNRHNSCEPQNPVSSGSHMIFKFDIVSTNKANQKTRATMRVVDLMGSEAMVNTPGSEACARAINGDLLVTSKLLIQLGRASPATEVSSESPLAYILRDALDGSTQVTLLATASPALMQYKSTHGVLKMADMCKGTPAAPPPLNKGSYLGLLKEAKEADVVQDQ